MKMIIFFHFICLIARYIVLNISNTFRKPKVSDETIPNITSSFNSSAEYCHKRRIEYPKHPIYEDGLLKFFPPVFVQRYETVAFTLQSPELEGRIRKVVDFGCAELGFFMYLKSIESVTEILEVDIDSDILESYSFKAAPLTSDYLMGKRDKPLNVYILAGSVAEYDDHLLGCDAVVAIELIEHLTEEELEKMPYNIFCKIKPKIAIFTTPNADFNSLLPNCTNMRHKDHKFEWTRKEFFEWTQQILNDYPEYHVRFFGIGAGPEGTENLGCCSQMAVFQRSKNYESFVSSRDNAERYKLIKHYEFPAYIDPRTTEEKIVHEIQYHSAYLKGLDKYYNFETNESEIPLSLLKEYVSGFKFKDEELMKILNNNGMTLRRKNSTWFLIYSDSESNSSDYNFSCESLLNEDLLINDSCDKTFEHTWSDDEPLNVEKLVHFQSGTSLKMNKEFSFNVTNLTFSHEEDREFVSTTNHRNTSVFENCNSLLQTESTLQKSPSLDVKSHEIRKSGLAKSRIPCKKSGKKTEVMVVKKKNISQVGKSFKKILKSNSLDSWLENFNFRPSEHVLSPCKKKYWINHSDSSLLSSSFDKAGDSGYPFSFSPPSEDLTPEQVDEFFTENEMSRSVSPSSEVDIADIADHRLHHDVY